MKAVWNGITLAESDKTIVIEGNHYFPPDAVNRELFQPSNTHTTFVPDGPTAMRAQIQPCSRYHSSVRAMPSRSPTRGA